MCRLRGLRLGGAVPRLGSTLQCVSAEVVSCGGLIFDVLQRIVSVDADADGSEEVEADPTEEAGGTAEVLAECTVRCCAPLPLARCSCPSPHALVDADRCLVINRASPHVPHPTRAWSSARRGR